MSKEINVKKEQRYTVRNVPVTALTQKLPFRKVGTRYNTYLSRIWRDSFGSASVYFPTKIFFNINWAGQVRLVPSNE